jgi:hypothetical protein
MGVAGLPITACAIMKDKRAPQPKPPLRRNPVGSFVMPASVTTLSAKDLMTETLFAAIVRWETPSSDTGSYDILWFRPPQAPGHNATITRIPRPACASPLIGHNADLG